MSYKDETLLARLDDLGVKAYDEDVTLIGRHVIEHKDSPFRFLRSWQYAERFIVEVPDSSRILENEWFPFVWEEHRSYFTEATLRNLASIAGYKCEVIRYPMAYEDLLIGIFERGNPEPMIAEPTKFGRSYATACEYWQGRTDGRKVALVGAGHLACKFINLYGIRVEFVADDDANKQGMLMPGSQAPIVPTSRLQEVDLVLSSLAPESQERFNKRHGIKTESIFSAIP
jgi:hypothetical protein